MTTTAVVHEWLESRAGSEKTFEEIARALPDADLYALTATPGVSFDFGGRPVTTTFLDRASLRHRRSLTLPVMPLAWRMLQARRPTYDMVVTSTHAFGNLASVTRRARTVLCYCHTPARYLWTPQLDARSSRFDRLLGPARAVLRRVDAVGARRVTEFAANSTEVATRIEQFYGVRARVIAPPVDTSFFADGASSPTHEIDDLPDSYLMAMSRFIPYKRLDLAIEVAAALGMPIVVAGSGGEEQALRRHAEAVGADARFVIGPSQVELRELFRRAALLVFPAYEDFGIVPVEAQACGTPVVALAAGGSLDTVVDGVTGALAAAQTVEAFTESARLVLDTLAHADGTAAACRAHARDFSAELFRSRIQAWVHEHDV